MGGVIAPSFEELAAQQEETPAETPATTTTAEGTDETSAPVTTESPSGDGEA